MRWFIVRFSDGVVPAFVVAECIDEAWSRDQLRLIDAQVVLSEDELRLDPDLVPALEAWQHRDDGAYEAFLSLDEADKTISFESFLAEEESEPDRGTSDEERLEQSRRYSAEWAELGEDLERYLSSVGVEPGAEYFVSLQAFRRLWLVERKLGKGKAAETARALARQFGSYASESARSRIL